MTIVAFSRLFLNWSDERRGPGLSLKGSDCPLNSLERQMTSELGRRTATMVRKVHHTDPRGGKRKGRQMYGYFMKNALNENLMH